MSIGEKSVQCDVVVRSDCLRASDNLLDGLIELLPSLPEHACASDGIGVFGNKMRGTSLPHLAEHVAIDLLVRSCSDEEVGFSGNTVWLDKGRNLMRVRVSYQDARVTKVALLAAINLINQLTSEISLDEGFAQEETMGEINQRSGPSLKYHPSRRIMAILQDFEARRNH